MPPAKRSLPPAPKEKEKKVPKLCYCKECDKGTDTQNYMVKCSVKGIWQHSVMNCIHFENK